ncbi:MAG: hypothetical protein ACJ75B_03595 [Flavisolibacter sp.]
MNSNTLEESLKLFERTLQILALTIYDKLSPGLPKEYLVEMLSRLRVKDENLVTLFNWKNGIENGWQYKITEYDICSFGKMPDFNNAVSLYLAGKASGSPGKHLFPVMTSFGGDYLYYDMNTKSKTFASLLVYSPAILVNKPVAAFECLPDFFNCINKCFLDRIYSLDDTGRHLNIDFEKETSFMKERNPKVKFWKL